MYAYGGFVQGFVQGFVRGVDWGLGRGFVLEDHPGHWTKCQEAPGTRGSAGIPDSLGHKPACTSGAVVWSGGLVTVITDFEFPSLWSVIVANVVRFIYFVTRLRIARDGKPAALPFRVSSDLWNHEYSHRPVLVERRSTRIPG